MLSLSDKDTVGLQIGSLASHLTEVQSTLYLTLSLNRSNSHGISVLLSGSSDGMIVAWDVEFSQQLLSWKAHTGGIIMMAADPLDTNCFWTQGRDGCVHKWCFSRTEPIKASSCPDQNNELTELDNFLNDLLEDSPHGDGGGSSKGPLLTIPNKEATILCGFGSFCKMHVFAVSATGHTASFAKSGRDMSNATSDSSIRASSSSISSPNETFNIPVTLKTRGMSKFSFLEEEESSEQSNSSYQASMADPDLSATDTGTTGTPSNSDSLPSSTASISGIRPYQFDAVLIAVPAVDSGVIEIWDSGYRSIPVHNPDFASTFNSSATDIPFCERYPPCLLISTSIPAYAAEYVVSELIGTVETRLPNASEVPPTFSPIPEVLQKPELLEQELQAWHIFDTKSQSWVTPCTQQAENTSSVASSLLSNNSTTSTASVSSIQDSLLQALSSSCNAPSNAPVPLLLRTTPSRYTYDTSYLSILAPGGASSVRDLVQKGGTILAAQALQVDGLSDWRHQKLVEQYRKGSASAAEKNNASRKHDAPTTTPPSSPPFSDNLPFSGEEKSYNPSSSSTTFFETFRQELSGSHGSVVHSSQLPQIKHDSDNIISPPRRNDRPPGSRLPYVPNARYQFIPKYGIVNNLLLLLATESGGIYICDVGTLFLQPPTNCPTNIATSAQSSSPSSPLPRHSNVVVAALPLTRHSILTLTCQPSLPISLPATLPPTYAQIPSRFASSNFALVGTSGPHAHFLQLQLEQNLPGLQITRSQSTHAHVFTGQLDGWNIRLLQRIPIPEKGISALTSLPVHPRAGGSGGLVLDAFLGSWGGNLYWLRLSTPEVLGDDDGSPQSSDRLGANAQGFILREILPFPHASAVNSLSILSDASNNAFSNVRDKRSMKTMLPPVTAVSAGADGRLRVFQVRLPA